MKVSISRGNEKLGSIQSVSLPSGLTCRECDCSRKCYARRIERRRPSVAAAYRNNLQVLETEPATYWREVEAAIMLSRFFRFHVSGDIPNTTYFHIMMEVAKRNSHCEILCFTYRKVRRKRMWRQLHGMCLHIWWLLVFAHRRTGGI